MLKKVKNEELKVPANVYFVHGYKPDKFEKLIGTLLSRVELLGLSEKQEMTLKYIIKQDVWDMWDRPQFSYEYDFEDNLI